VNYDLYNEKSGLNIIRAVVFFIIVSCCILNSAYALNTTDHNISKEVLYATFIFFVFITIIKKEINVKMDNAIMFYIVLMMSFALSIFFNFSPTTVLFFFRIIMVVTVAFLITRYVDFKTFVKYYIKIVKFLTVTSLIAWITVAIIGAEWLPTIINRNDVTYHNGILFFFYNLDSGIQIRNMSVFWEPGIYASFLIIALVFETCFKEGKESKYNILLFILGLISTQSSAGYALFLLYICLRLSMSKGQLRFVTLTFVFGFSVIIYFFIDSISLWLLNWNYDIFYKFFSDQNATTGTRLYSPLLNLQIFSESPIWGQGFYKAERSYVELMVSTYSNYRVVAQTSTSALYMAAIGIMGAIYTLAWIISIIKLKTFGILTRIIIISIFLLIVNKEPHTSIITTYCILFYLLAYSKKYKRKTIED
jgi:hypothetical protein